MSCLCWLHLVGEVKRPRRLWEGVGREWWEKLERRILLVYYVGFEYMEM
jgi:hypothetical protein